MTLLLLAWLVAVAITVGGGGGGVKSAVGRERGMEDTGRENICCSCSRLTSLKSPADEELGCALAVVRVDIRLLSRGIVELERERERERKKERERRRGRAHYRQQVEGQPTTLLSHQICSNTNVQTYRF